MSADPAKAAPGGCNEGFVREDAILVVVLVTDDPPHDFDMDDAHPSTGTTGWYDAVVAAKGGDVESIVVIGFVPWMNTSCNGAESPNLIGFVQEFGEQGVLASVCDPDYGRCSRRRSRRSRRRATTSSRRGEGRSSDVSTPPRVSRTRPRPRFGRTRSTTSSRIS